MVKVKHNKRFFGMLLSSALLSQYQNMAHALCIYESSPFASSYSKTNSNIIYRTIQRIILLNNKNQILDTMSAMKQ